MIALVVAVALVVDEKHLKFVSTNCAPPVVDQKHTLNLSIDRGYLVYIYIKLNIYSFRSYDVLLIYISKLDILLYYYILYYTIYYIIIVILYV